MKETNHAIFMEPEEYEAYVKTQREKLQAYYESLKNNQGDNNNINSPTLYELNQQLIEKMPVLSSGEIRKCSGKILKYLVANPDTYYALLCNELNYYTLFHITSAEYNISGELIINHDTMHALIEEIIELIINLGDVKVIDKDNNGAIAIWSSFKPTHSDQVDDKIHCFYLFPYGRGVIEV